MKNSKWIIFTLALVLMIAAAGVLLKLKNRPHLTQPGVKVGLGLNYDEDGKLAGESSVLLPTNVPGCTSQARPIAKIELTSLPRDTTFGRRLYSFPDGFQSLASVVLMGSDRTSIHQPQFCLVGQGYDIATQENITLPIERPFPYTMPALKLTASKMVKDTKGQPVLLRGIYVYWFVSEDQITAGQGTLMWSMMRTLVHKGLLERWAYVSYFAVCYPGQEQATFNRLRGLIHDSVPEFQITTGAKIQ